jgi:hypothetical protein
MSNFGFFKDKLHNFTWAIAEDELEYKNGEIIIIGWYCSDRICLKGFGEKSALYYENYGG